MTASDSRFRLPSESKSNGLIVLQVRKETGMQSKNLRWMALFAVSMAYFEAAVVVYLRRLYNIDDLMISKPLLDPQIGAIEVGREAASLIMLLAAGWVAGKKFQARLGFSLFAFGIWDIFYYIWLNVFIGWPGSMMDTDILFYIPLPWWGPVLAPVLIATLMIVAGAYAVINYDKGMSMRASLFDWVVLAGSIILLLYAFMADALKALPADTLTLHTLRPSQFNWSIYLIGLSLAAVFVWKMASSKLETVRQVRRPAHER
jgi:hypothetical protein